MILITKKEFSKKSIFNMEDIKKVNSNMIEPSKDKYIYEAVKKMIN